MFEWTFLGRKVAPLHTLLALLGCAAAAVVAAVVVRVAERRLAPADDVQVAVAANFAGAMQRITADFARDTGHHAVVTSAATGTLYAQIRSGAPFDLLLAADENTPRQLESDGLALPGSRFTYALGRLALWSATPGLVGDDGGMLRQAACSQCNESCKVVCGDACKAAVSPKGHIAIANPKLAPYGVAALEVLDHLGIRSCLEPRIVQGESVAQAAEFVATGSAALGFVALSQVRSPGHELGGSLWLVPSKLYSPIHQQAVLLRRGETREAARLLFAYLKQPSTRELIRSYGYGVEDMAAVSSP